LLDWEALYLLARAERLDPLLYVALLAAGRLAALPRPLAAQLEAAHWHARIANLLALDAVGQLASALAAVDVPVVLLKGAALAFGLYSDPARRALGDIDILVKPADVPKALRVMRLLGYAPVGPLRGVPDDQAAPGADHEGWRSEVALVREGKLPTQIDLHWGLNSRTQLRRSMDAQWFWEHTTPLTLRGRSAASSHRQNRTQDGETVCIFGTEAQLLHLCAHSLQHGAPRLRWTYDIALLLARRTIDWDIVLPAAASFHLGLALQVTLAAVWVLWGVAPPVCVQARLHALTIGGDERRTWRLTCSGNQQALKAWDVISLGNAREALDAWLAAALPPPGAMCRRYGVCDQRLLPGLYLYRAVNGSVRGGWGMLRRWRK
jgi:hypothetical protein